jgi:hypothetical protein
MAQFLIRNSLNPYKVVKCGITFEQVIPKGIEGEPIWVVELATDEPHKNGGVIPPEFINLVSLNNLDEEIQQAVETISSKIDWTPLEDDLRAPFVESCYPSTYEVDITSYVEIIIKDLLPSAGIDVDSISMTITADGMDFDVTNELEITGDPFEYTVKWMPFMRVRDEY